LEAWYLVICYLKQNQPDKAKPLLIKLQKKTTYGDEAKAILKKLK